MVDYALKKLNLGCGEDQKEGYINVDWSPLAKPDVVHDLNMIPYPFEDNSIDIIEVFHVLEHLDKPFVVMKEFQRILKVGGTLHVKVPHFSRGFTHAEHAHGFDVTFPLYFNKNFTRSGYYGVPLDLKSMRLSWLAFFHLLPYMGYGGGYNKYFTCSKCRYIFLCKYFPSIYQPYLVFLGRRIRRNRVCVYQI